MRRRDATTRRGRPRRRKGRAARGAAGALAFGRRRAYLGPTSTRRPEGRRWGRPGQREGAAIATNIPTAWRLSAPDKAARLSVAPMMAWTDRHCRAFHRTLSRRALLYTEMVTAAAVLRGDRARLLAFDPAEHPVAVQLGGCDPAELAEATAACVEAGYDEVNLNVGCPSDRVRSGRFGAVLMREPALVGRLARAMRDAAGPVPVTVKCRVGVDEQEPARVLPDLLARLGDAGVRRVVVHARKAWLQGLSPKENREVPPLDRPLVHAMKRRFPALHLSVNGGIASLDEAMAELRAGMDGAMVGRAAYHDPGGVLLRADSRIFGAPDPQPDRIAAADAMVPHIAQHLAEGGRLHDVTRHMLGLFAGRPGARTWRRALSERGADRDAGLDDYLRALEPLRRHAA